MSRLERAGRALVDDPVAEPRDVEEIARAAHRRRTRRRTGTGATALVLVAALVVSVLALTGGDDDPQVIAGPSDPDALYADATWHRTYLQAPGGGAGVAAALTLLAYDGTTFVGFAPYEGESISTAEAWWSTDAKTWSTGRVEVAPQNERHEISDLVATGDGFVAVGRLASDEDGARAAVWTSPDGRDWRLTTYGAPQWFDDAIVWNDSVWVAGQVLREVDRAVPLIARLDPQRPDELLLGEIADASALGGPLVVAASDDELVAVSEAATGDGTVVLRSANGTDWTAVDPAADAPDRGLTALVHGGGSFVGFERPPTANDAPAVWTTSTGDDWTRTGELEPGATVRDAVAVPEGFVAIGDVDAVPAVWTSRDGDDWTRIVDQSETLAGVENDVVLHAVTWIAGDLVIAGGVAEPSGGFTPTIWATTDELVPEPATTTTAPHPTPGPVLRPGEMAIAGGMRGVLAVDVESGATRVVHEWTGEGEGGGVVDVAVAPGGAVWFVQETGVSLVAQPSIWRLDTSGPAVMVVDDARAPAVSPDGRYLAYATAGVLPHPRDIVVRDLDAGDERRFAPDPNDPDFFRVNGRVLSIEWSPDGSRLTYGFEYEGKETYVLDVADEEPNYVGTGFSGAYTSPVWVSDETLLAVERCCYPEGEVEPVRVRVVTIDVATGDATELPALSGLDLVQVGTVGDTVFGITLGGELWVEDDVGERRLVAEGVFAAAS